jgi:hypothetical protein
VIAVADQGREKTKAELVRREKRSERNAKGSEATLEASEARAAFRGEK